ncbi:DEAD/DEAH box helicase [Xylogone sp. PMI_703]|nr:DEAD/DEAH box helicase [Xylogone sp. PMI_703]
MEKSKSTFHRTTVERSRAGATAWSRTSLKSFQKSGSEAPGSSALANRVPDHIRAQVLQKLSASKIQDVHPPSCTPSEYSQRKALALTPTPAFDPLLHLSHPCYGLPQSLVDNFSSMGISSIYPWQARCLRGPGLLDGQKNLVYTAPTGGGKSLVADVLMLKMIMENPQKKALLVLPYVALVQEKLRWLRKAVNGIKKDVPTSPHWRGSRMSGTRGDEDHIRVVGYFGGSKVKAAWHDVDIAVCTIEKANSLLNETIHDFSVASLGIVVIDELHMLGDDQRGHLLELLASKLLTLENKVQIIGMSATLKNASLIAKWLDNAHFYESKYRPIPIEEYLVVDNRVYPASASHSFQKMDSQSGSKHEVLHQIGDPHRLILPSEYKELNPPLINAVVSLANETVRAGYGVLIFSSSRAGCERDALIISRVLPPLEEVDIDAMERRLDLLRDLAATSTGMDSVLERTVPFGVAFHHAGMTTEERDLVSLAYEAGTIKAVVATCSLAAGLNLPARRVILHGARMGSDIVGPAMLRQMRGRAGRKGKDEVGETYLCCNQNDLEAIAELMEADLPDVESYLSSGEEEFKRALLEVITIKLATNIDTIEDYAMKTFLSLSADQSRLTALIQEALRQLERDSLITVDPLTEYAPTLLGQAIVFSSFAPDDGLFIHNELKRALKGFVMDNEMHVLYLFTPVQALQSSIDWRIYRNEIESLDESGLRVLAAVGVKPTIINKMAQGGLMVESSPELIEIARIYRRLYAAFQLRDLCNEIPIHVVANKYSIPRGAVQALSQHCHSFAAGMIKFCERMQWGPLSAILDHYSDRLKAGARSDLLALAEITYIKSRTARIFWENGYKTVGSVASADPRELLPILLLAQPRKPRLDPDGEQKSLQKLMAKAEIISRSANFIWERQMRQEYEEE